MKKNVKPPTKSTPKKAGPGKASPEAMKALASRKSC